MAEFLSKLFSSDFMPHGHCYFWNPEIVWLHATSDGLIALSYYFIPLMLIYFVRKRRDLAFGWMFVMFGIFILGCGTTHLMEVWTLWHGTYRLAGVIKAVTAGASLATAAALVPLIPRALALPSPAALRAANLELEKEIGQRRRAEEELQQAHAELEHRVRDRTAALAAANEQLQVEIDEHRRTSQKLRTLASVVEYSPDFIGIASLEGDAEFVNPAGQALVGLAADEQVRKTKILDYVAEEDRQRFQDQALPGALRDGHWKGEILFRNFATGASIPVWQDVFLTTEPGTDRPLALATISRDLRERKRAADALHAAQAQVSHIARVTTMGELAASIAHEVNQPLTAVVMNGNACLRWLAGANPNLDEARAALTRVVKEGSRAGDIIRKIRALLKKSPPLIAPVDLNEVIQEALVLTKHEMLRSGVSARTELAGDLPIVPGDRVSLQQVILNLVVNAIEATRMIADGPRELVISSQSDGPGEAVIAVSDSGVGIDDSNLDQIFDAFFTTKQDGMGMGLSISRSIIEMHGGRLWATSNESPGATFRFSLPTVASAHA
jgi:PAS domain S-box-containing protein